AYYMDLFAEGSRNIVNSRLGVWTIVGDSTHLNELSLKDLATIRRHLVDKKIYVNDLQFLIRADGRVAIADPLGIPRVRAAGPSEYYLKQIDELIEAAHQ